MRWSSRYFFDHEIVSVFVVCAVEPGRGGFPRRVAEERHIAELAFIRSYCVQAFFVAVVSERQPVFFVYLFQHGFLVFFVHDHEIGRVVQAVYLLLEDLVARAVKGQDPAAVLVWHIAAYALFHFVGGFVGKRD